MSMKKYYVYILLCADNSYYTGITSDVIKRMEEHQSNKHIKSYTHKRQPVILKFYSEFTNVTVAIAKEKQIKKWSRAKKEALINGEYETLINLAKKHFKK